MKIVVAFWLLLQALSAVHGGGLFGGIRNCRNIQCFYKVGPVTINRWTDKVCGHSCGTVHQRTPERCSSSNHEKDRIDRLCNARTFEHGTPQGSYMAYDPHLGVVRMYQRKVRKNLSIFQNHIQVHNRCRSPPTLRESLTAKMETIRIRG